MPKTEEFFQVGELVREYAFQGVIIQRFFMGEGEFAYEVPELGYVFDTLDEAKDAIRGFSDDGED